MATATNRALSLHVQWSRWFHCECSFDLSLVPEGPGLYAVGLQLHPGRELQLEQVAAADNLFRALNSLFNADGLYREDLQQGRCFLRYAEVEDPTLRDGALSILDNWIAGRVPPDAKPGFVEDFLTDTGLKSHPFRDKDD